MLLESPVIVSAAGSSLKPRPVIKVYGTENHFKLNFIDSTGLDGRACVMRALCEAAQRDTSHLGKGTLTQELLHAIFTLPRDGGRFEREEDRAYEDAYRATENCERLYPSCRHSIYELEF